jgi:eukaryotic-like serine/threonine-protein kinase
VSFAHNKGVVHRDLKPGNVMVGSHGQVYVMDWGIAQLNTTPIEHESQRVRISTGANNVEPAGTLTGTPAYMAPEQAQGRTADVDARTDVYGLGGILYFFLTQRPPHDGLNLAEDLERAKRGVVRPPTEVITHAALPPGLCRIAMKALECDPAQRYASVEALKQDVESFLRGGGWFAMRRFDAGSVIVEEGDHAAAAYVIIEGQLELHKVIGGERRFLRLMGPGEVFGETAIFGSSTRTATVIAAGEVQLLVVTREALERELDRSVWLRAFVEALAERFLEVDRKLTQLQSERPPRT